MKIINQILLLSLILVMGCDDKVKSYSVIGTWDSYSRFEGETNWNGSDRTWEFNSDGSILTYNGSNTLKAFYYFCKSENVLYYSDQPISDEMCNCETSTSTPFEVTFDGFDTMYWEVCSDNGDKYEYEKEIIKFEKR